MMTVAVARKFHHAWRVSERAVPSAYKPSSSPSSSVDGVRSNSHYYLSFENKLLDLFPRRPTSPPSCSSSSLLFLLSRLPIIISTRMTRAPLLSSTFPRIGSPPSFGHTMMHPTGYYIYIYISLADFYYIAFDFFKKGPAYTT